MPADLFHFSDSHGIERFEPRAVQMPSPRPEGQQWLNGPLVWAIDAWHQPLYLFPRDCPRILLWATSQTTDQDRTQYFGSSQARMLAYVESSWVPDIETETLCCYSLPSATFESLEDAGMWVSRFAVEPSARRSLINLPQRLRQAGVEVRVVDSLSPMRDVWATSLHASGIRLRNAQGW